MLSQTLKQIKMGNLMLHSSASLHLKRECLQVLMAIPSFVKVVYRELVEVFKS